MSDNLRNGHQPLVPVRIRTRPTFRVTNRCTATVLNRLSGPLIAPGKGKKLRRAGRLSRGYAKVMEPPLGNPLVGRRTAEIRGVNSAAVMARRRGDRKPEASPVCRTPIMRRLSACPILRRNSSIAKFVYGPARALSVTERKGRLGWLDDAEGWPVTSTFRQRKIRPGNTEYSGKKASSPRRDLCVRRSNPVGKTMAAPARSLRHAMGRRSRSQECLLFYAASAPRSHDGAEARNASGMRRSGTAAGILPRTV